MAVNAAAPSRNSLPTFRRLLRRHLVLVLIPELAAIILDFVLGCIEGRLGESSPEGTTAVA